MSNSQEEKVIYQKIDNYTVENGVVGVLVGTMLYAAIIAITNQKVHEKHNN